jgi:hypothetical protein
MSEGTILQWTPDKVAQFGAVPLKFNHGLQSHPLFSEQAIVRILDDLGRHDYRVSTTDISPDGLHKRRQGEIKGMSGEQVLESVRRGQIWVLRVAPEKREPAYLDLLHQIYTEVQRMVPGFKLARLGIMALIISSPKAHVTYHADVPGQTLWQIRGKKRVFVYPNKPPFLPQAAFEKITIRETDEYIPYDKSFDEKAVVFDLEPGQMLYWPLNAPHRIENADCVNVSFTTEHSTAAERRFFFVNYANGILRNRFGRQRLSQKTTGLGYWSKLALAAAFKATGNVRKRAPLHIDFHVDPTAPRSVRSVPAYIQRP